MGGRAKSLPYQRRPPSGGLENLIMETFQVAHLNVQNVNVIIIFLASTFEHKSAEMRARYLLY